MACGRNGDEPCGPVDGRLGNGRNEQDERGENNQRLMSVTNWLVSGTATFFRLVGE